MKTELIIRVVVEHSGTRDWMTELESTGRLFDAISESDLVAWPDNYEAIDLLRATEAS